MSGNIPGKGGKLPVTSFATRASSRAACCGFVIE
jgi:hypothetical protein